MKQIHDHCSQCSDQFAEPANLDDTSGSTESGLTTHRCFNSPAVDVRTTARWYYFDIELPGVKDESGIKIHLVSPQTFVVEGEIPRPHISVRDEWDDVTTDKNWKCIGTAIGSHDGLASPQPIDMRKQTETLVHESLTPEAEITPKPIDNYPGFPHLLRCPGSHLHRDVDSRPEDPMPTDSLRSEDYQEDPEPSMSHPPPMDEIALMRSRSHSFKSSPGRRKPHSAHDFQPSTNVFGFLFHHNKKQSSQHVGHSHSAASAPAAPVQEDKACSSFTTSKDTMQPIENKSEPQLIFAERLVGTYKRCCTVPGDRAGELHFGEMEAKLEAGVLTVRVPRRTG